MIRNVLRSQKKSIFYSIVSLLNVGCGLAVTALIWFEYSATSNADVLLLATSTVAVFVQLSLVGIEQVMYFYVDENRVSVIKGGRFLNVAFTWALISGVIFSITFLFLSRLYLSVTASGLTLQDINQANYLLVCLSPMLIMSPGLHVVRAKWIVEEKFSRAYLLSALNSFVVLVSLITTMAFGTSELNMFGKIACFILASFLVVFLILNRKKIVWPNKEEQKSLCILIKHSASIKGANSVHNFLVQALINSILSHLGTGAISIFQYAKKLADGVFAITAGPQVMIYHARCAVSIAKLDIHLMKTNAKEYVRTFLPLFFGFAGAVYFFAPFIFFAVSKHISAFTISEILYVYLGVVVWYLIMGIETLSVGIVLSTKNSLSLFLVNLTFISSFFIWTNFHTIRSVPELVFTTASFQILSFILFSASAFLIVKRRLINAS